MKRNGNATLGPAGGVEIILLSGAIFGGRRSSPGIWPTMLSLGFRLASLKLSHPLIV
jgi:hypothetical protein